MACVIKFENGTEAYLVGDPKTKVKAGGSLLGKGGQGAVYLVKDAKGEKKALKRYHIPMSTSHLESLRNIIKLGAPSRHFLWPLALSEPMGYNKNIHGYIMDVYDSSQYVSFTRLMKGKATFPSKEVQLQTLLDLVDAFDILHKKGLCIHDVDDSAFMFDCLKGQVLIGNCDTVAQPNAYHSVHGGNIKITAPEVFANMFEHDKYTDRFSLAVLMFMILTHTHPYNGKKGNPPNGQPLTPDTMQNLYVREPVFIFHPTDTSNRPDPEDTNALNLWPTIPEFVQDLFIKTFTSGMPSPGISRDEIVRDRQNRTGETEWREALQRWMDTMCACPTCGYTVCPTLKDHAFLPMHCPHCHKEVTLKLPVMNVKKKDATVRTIVLDKGKIIPRNFISQVNTTEPAIEIVQSSSSSDTYGIKNLLPYPWRHIEKGELFHSVAEPGMIIDALDGLIIEFDDDFSGELNIYKTQPDRSTILVIPVIDTSEAMAGDKIAQVNEAMHAVFEMLPEINGQFQTVRLTLAPLQFSDSANWCTPGCKKPSDEYTFLWIDLMASGDANFDIAYKQLAEKLTDTDRGGWMSTDTAMPIILLITGSTPVTGCRESLAALKKKKWFNGATRLAITVGSLVDNEAVTDFVGGPSFKDAIYAVERFQVPFADILRLVIYEACLTVAQAIENADEETVSAPKNDGNNLDDFWTLDDNDVWF